LTGPPFCGILCSRLHGLTCILTIGMVNISLFKNFVPLGALLPTDRAELAKYSRVGVYQPGQIIFSRGESAQTVPFLISGEVEVFDGGHGHVIRGDTPEARNALANGPRRVTTATCLKTAQVLLVDREHMDLILTWSQTGGLEVTEHGSRKSGGDDESQDWMTALLQNQAFHRIPPGNIAQLFACMQSAKFNGGETIIQQGDRGDCYFILTEGRVQVVQQDADGFNETEVSQLGVGRGFGEEAVLSGNPRNATVRALTDVAVMKIDAHDFERLLKAPVLSQMVIEEVTAEHQLIDVRLTDEFVRGHVPGAISLPLARLRELAVQLDARRPCAVYCDSGRRSASATYLLCERGFDARLVAGGVPAELMTESH
ncbi:MAG TPA: cyclic nucleotide-binding domain-containing protein, partial [Pseudomonadota bacterium]|nr:cyclic nucleotide-binding domain-containing protein [Pseudomonadota bacterium]